MARKWHLSIPNGFIHLVIKHIAHPFCSRGVEEDSCFVLSWEAFSALSVVGFDNIIPSIFSSPSSARLPALTKPNSRIIRRQLHIARTIIRSNNNILITSDISSRFSRWLPATLQHIFFVPIRGFAHFWNAKGIHNVVRQHPKFWPVKRLQMSFLLVYVKADSWISGIACWLSLMRCRKDCAINSEEPEKEKRLNGSTAMAITALRIEYSSV